MSTINEETGEITEEHRIRAFTEFLLEHRHGELHGEISASLNELAQSVVGIGKPGTLTITITVEPAGASHEQVFVKDDVQLKLPKPTRESAICFVDDDSNLVRRDPRQPEIPGLREVPASKTATAAKEVTA